MTFARQHGWPSRTLAQLSLSCALTAALAAGLVGCAGSSSGAGSNSAAAGASGRAGTSSGAAAGAGVAGAGAAGAGVPATSGNAAANVPAAARTLLCPPPIASSRTSPRSVSQSIPAGFTAVAVVRCIPTAPFGPAQGSWAYERKQVAVSGLGPLLAALREPSALHVRPGPASGCPVPAASGVRLALVGADGAVVYPRIPVTTCGVPIQPVMTSLAALHWITLSTPVAGAASAPQTVGGASS